LNELLVQELLPDGTKLLPEDRQIPASSEQISLCPPTG
jgi:hypothetical protein